MKKITISDLDGFTDICECEKMLGELKAGCSYNPFSDAANDSFGGEKIEEGKKFWETVNPPNNDCKGSSGSTGSAK